MKFRTNKNSIPELFPETETLQNESGQQLFLGRTLKKSGRSGHFLPVIVIALFIVTWYLVRRFELFPSYSLPSPGEVYRSFILDMSSGRLLNDIIASLWRVVIGFVGSSLLAIPLGLWIGHNLIVRRALLPLLNFFRFLSPLSWIPFAILWFHIGDKPAIFLIFMATFFPLVIATMAAVSRIPRIYYFVAKDYNYSKFEVFAKVTFPSVLPQIITALRITYGIAWVVIVAAEMVGCQDGLGYGIWEARNGLRLDSAVSYMIIIGLLGMGIDRCIAQLQKLKNLTWGYAQ